MMTLTFLLFSSNKKTQTECSSYESSNEKGNEASEPDDGHLKGPEEACSKNRLHGNQGHDQHVAAKDTSPCRARGVVTCRASERTRGCVEVHRCGSERPPKKAD